MKKIILDIFMLIIFILLMNLKLTGLVFHEIFGITIGLVVIIHLLLNKKWIKSIGSNLKNKNLNKRSKVMFYLNIFTCISLLVLIITGILISRYILTSITVTNLSVITTIHTFSANLSLALICIHIGIHLDYLINSFKNIIINKKLVLKLTLTFAIIIALYIPISKYVSNNGSNMAFYNSDTNNTKGHRDFNNMFGDESSDSNTRPEPPDMNSNGDFPKRGGNSSGSSNGESINPSQKDDNESITSDDESASDSDLSSFLSKLTCTGCGRQCLLSNPKCNKGVRQAQEATEEYNNNSNSSSTTNGDI